MKNRPIITAMMMIHTSRPLTGRLKPPPPDFLSPRLSLPFWLLSSSNILIAASYHAIPTFAMNEFRYNWRTMRIGSLQLESNLFLSPLAGYTNLPFRLVVREIGGVGLCTTDLVNARSLIENRDRALKLIETRPADSPLAVQLFGSVPEEMRDAALIVEARGAVSVDINMGCPVKKVCKVGGGSAMMTELDKTTALVRGMVGAVKIPVTAKMRLGWDDDNLTAPDLARALEDAGVAAISVHGRTREQGFSGSVNLAGIRAVAQAVKRIPVIGNGDVTTPQAAKMMFDETGCAGVSMGRGAFYNPWIFLYSFFFLCGLGFLPVPEL